MKKFILILLMIPSLLFAQNSTDIQKQIEESRFKPIEIPGNQFYKLQNDLSLAGKSIVTGSNFQKLGFLLFAASAVCGVVAWKVPDAENTVVPALIFGGMGCVSYTIGTFYIGNGGKKLSNINLNRINP